MNSVESQGTKDTVFHTQLLPPEAHTSNVGVFHRYLIEQSEWEMSASTSKQSLLSSVPLTTRQIELGQQIARKHGLTE